MVASGRNGGDVAIQTRDLKFRKMLGLAHGLVNLGINVCDFRGLETGLSSAIDRILYAIPSEAHREDFDRKKSFLPDDIEAYELINEELSDPMSFIMKIRDNDELLREWCLEFNGRLEEQGNQLWLDRIFTTSPAESGGRSVLLLF